MITTTFESLVPKWYSFIARHRVGILRVYPTTEVKEPTKYKFFTIASIEAKRCHIIGVSDAHVTIKDLHSIADCVKIFKVKELYWTHNNRLKVYKLNYD